ncbi:MAG: hypothetical protein IJ493_00165 [Clostridia bacterium]|nr:hypothetical protein [Clostridia bacterium]
MSNREKCAAIIDGMNEPQLESLLIMLEASQKLSSQLEGIMIMLRAAKKMQEEAEDDAFCEQLLREYENDPDKGESVTLEEMAALCGVDLNEL